jgi:hypothetical protein
LILVRLVLNEGGFIFLCVPAAEKTGDAIKAEERQGMSKGSVKMEVAHQDEAAASSADSIGMLLRLLLPSCDEFVRSWGLFPSPLGAA